jgi:hypothetical protein
MTYEKGLFAQADPGIVSGSTIERKKMSTKTIYKRIALVAVTALGAGVLSVAPANAAVGTTIAPTLTTLSHAGTAAAPLIQGTAFTSNLTWTLGTAAMVATEVCTVTYAVADPVGNVVNNATFTKVAGPVGTNGVVTQSTASAGQSTGQAITITAGVGDVAAAAYVLGTIAFTPTMGGNYAVTSTSTGAGCGGAKTEMVGTTNASRGLLYTQGISVTQGTTRGAAGAAVVGNQAQVRITYPEAEGTTYKAVSTGVGSILGATPTDANNTNISGLTTDFSKGLTTVTTTDATAHNNVLTLASTVAGDQTITVTTVDTTTGIGTSLYSIVITWGAASAVSTQYSLVRLLAGAVATDVTAATLDTAVTTVSSAAGTQYFTIQVETNDQNNVAMTGFTLGASIAGPGLIGIADSRTVTTATGRSLTVPLTGAFGAVSVWGDGTAGSGIITVTATNALGVTTVLGTKTVRFAGAVSKATVTQNLFVARAATQLGLTPTTSRVTATSAATTPALRAVVTDAAGVNVVAGAATVRLVSSNTAVITAGSCAEYTVTGTAGLAVPAPGTFECSVSGAASALSGQTATITFQVLNPATGLYDIVATPITFAIGGSIASTVVSVNKTSYLPGEAIVMTATAKDSSGNAAADGQNPYLTTASANMSVGGTFPVNTTAFIVSGVHSTTVAGVNSLFAPASTGTLTVTGLTAATLTAPAGAAYSASVTIASQANADITALTTLVNSLIAKINALNKLVIKIQKKVRA